MLAAQKITQGGGKLVPLWPSPNVADVLMVAGLDQLLMVARSEEEARVALGGGRSIGDRAAASLGKVNSRDQECG